MPNLSPDSGRGRRLNWYDRAPKYHYIIIPLPGHTRILLRYGDRLKQSAFGVILKHFLIRHGDMTSFELSLDYISHPFSSENGPF